MQKLKISLLALMALVVVQTFIRAEFKTQNLILNTQDSTKITVFPDSSRWILTKMVGVKSMKQHTGNQSFIVIKKVKQRIAGYTSCNSLRGKVVIQDSTISISDLLPTERVCDDATVEREKLFRDILQKSTSWKIVNNLLYLYENGILILEFKPSEQ